MSNLKEAIAIILDISPSILLESCNYLKQSLDAISLIIQRKIFTESKDEIAIILLGTRETKNALASESEYCHISIEYELAPASFEMLKFIKSFSPVGNVDADFIDAIVVAVDELIKKTEGRKGYNSRRLILFSFGCGIYNDDQMDEIIASCKEANIELNVIGPDMKIVSKLEFVNGKGDNNSHNSINQIKGDEILRKFIQCLGGKSFTFNEAISYLQFIHKKQTKSTAWKCLLKISRNLQIPICLYSKIKAAKANSFKSVYGKDVDKEIITSRTYHLKDEEETEIQKEDVIDGYRFGDILVPVSKDDKDAMKLKTEKSFKLLGFTKSENVKTEMYMGDTTWICVADPNDKMAGAMFSSLIRACYEMNMIGIVRRVYAATGQVKVGCLLPHLKDDYHYFYYIELPFAEDASCINMPSLPIERTYCCEQIKNHPTDEQLKFIDQLMTSMDLSKEYIGRDAEKFKHNKVFNPYLQRLYQCLEYRALYSHGDLPNPNQLHNLAIITENIAELEPIFNKINSIFMLEKVAEGNQLKKFNIYSNLDEKCTDNKDEKTRNLDNLHEFLQPKIEEIGSLNPVSDFHFLLAQNENKLEVILKMTKMILKLIMKSVSNELFPKIFNCLLSLRQQCIIHQLSYVYNRYLNDLRDELNSIGRLNFLNEFAESESSLGLISVAEDKTLVDVKDEICAAFLKSLSKSAEPMHIDKSSNDNDLINELD